MKAAVYIGDGRFELEETPLPKPAPGESLLEMSCAGVCGTDLRIFQGHLRERVGARRILGHEAVSIVREPGAQSSFCAGDRVVIEPTLSCGQCRPCRRGATHVCQNLRLLGIDVDGAFRQFWAVPEHRLHKLPDHLADDHAALIEPLAVAVHAVRQAKLAGGETVVVIGAGPIGVLIALLSRNAGAKVVVFEINADRVKFARQLQLNVLDSRGEDGRDAVMELTQGAGADVLFEASGSAAGARLVTSLASVQGRIVLVGIHDKNTPVDLYQIFSRELSIQGIRSYSSGDFRQAIVLAAAGELHLAAFISRQFPLERLGDGTARQGDLRSRGLRASGARSVRARRSRIHRAGLCARIPRFPLSLAQLAGKVPGHRRLVRSLRQARLHDVDAAADAVISAPLALT